MKTTNNTGKTGVLVLKVEEDDINTIFMNTDYQEDGSLQYAYDNFADVFSENVLEYAFAYAQIPPTQLTRKLREAAQSMIKLHDVQRLKNYFAEDVPEEDWDADFLRWYEKKGIFGEVILHLFLKEFKDTIVLLRNLVLLTSLFKLYKVGIMGCLINMLQIWHVF